MPPASISPTAARWKRWTRTCRLRWRRSATPFRWRRLTSRAENYGLFTIRPIAAACSAPSRWRTRPPSSMRWPPPQPPPVNGTAAAPSPAPTCSLRRRCWSNRAARVSGVVFTGSTATATQLQRALAARDGAIVPLIAETGCQNAMIVDSSALAEQVVKDVIRSAFNSAGQRCSALRVLFLQQEIAPKVIDMLTGALAELRIGDPAYLATDIGPLIDEAACRTLGAHAVRMAATARLLYEKPLPASLEHGCFFSPRVFEIDALSQLTGEVFGPVLHVIRYAARDLDKVIDQINNTGYGLTLGVHSRIESSARYIQSRIRAGKCYVNRDMIGAVVGVQPFGGEGLSGTGPKAGGPDYLLRFAVERTLSINTAAVGGNTSLLSLGDD